MPRKTKEQKEFEKDENIKVIKETKKATTSPKKEVLIEDEKTKKDDIPKKNTNAKKASRVSTKKVISSKDKTEKKPVAKSKIETKKASAKTNKPKSTTSTTKKSQKEDNSILEKLAKKVAEAAEKVSTSNKAEKKTSKKATTSKTTKSTTKVKSSSKQKTKSSSKSKTSKKLTNLNTNLRKILLSKKLNKNLKFKRITNKEKISIVEYYDLPYRYNQTVVKVLAQTPSTLFIYWDISDTDIDNFKKEYGDNFFETTKPILIVHNDTLNYAFEIEINDFANSWYLHVNDSKCSYRIELGRRPIVNNERIHTNYIYITQSNKIESPNDHILLDSLMNMKNIKFRNVKTNIEFSKSISDLSISKSLKEIYNIYDLYKLIYTDEDFEDVLGLKNPSSAGNPSSLSLSSRFK